MTGPRKEVRIPVPPAAPGGPAARSSDERREPAALQKVAQEDATARREEPADALAADGQTGDTHEPEVCEEAPAALPDEAPDGVPTREPVEVPGGVAPPHERPLADDDTKR